jgi:hypothetical protein
MIHKLSVTVWSTNHLKRSCARLRRFPAPKHVRSNVGDRLDALVLDGGISQSARLAGYTSEDFDSLLATNFGGRSTSGPELEARPPTLGILSFGGLARQQDHELSDQAASLSR